MTNLKTGDGVLFSDDFYTVEWIDDTGGSGLIGLKGLSQEIIVTSFLERIITKIEETEQ